MDSSSPTGDILPTVVLTIAARTGLKDAGPLGWLAYILITLWLVAILAWQRTTGTKLSDRTKLSSGGAVLLIAIALVLMD